MYLLILGVITAAILALLAVVYRVLKAAHARPPGTARPVHHDASHPRSGVERAVLTVLTRLIRHLLSHGVRLGPMMLLTVRGRTTGVPRTNPVDLFQRDGRHWLVATHTADASWVRNLRAAGEGTLALGRRRYTFTAVELRQDGAGAVLKDVLGPRMAKPLAGFVLRQTLQVPPDASLEEYISAAAQHPVFELAVSRDN
jgi:deazaflavin-dependent oxidoreductase (nitroreductase family)